MGIRLPLTPPQADIINRFATRHGFSRLRDDPRKPWRDPERLLHAKANLERLIELIIEDRVVVFDKPREH
jgi:hypothetical protein